MVVSLRHSAVLPYFLTYTGGGAVSDFNGNGLPEITLIRFSVPGGVLQPLSILEIDRDLTVTDITSSVIRGDAILQTDFGRRVMVRDINADGWDDLIIADHGLDADPSPGALNPVFLSDGQGGLVDHSAAFSKRIGFTHSLGVGDLDGDGQTDIFFGDIGNDVAYLVSWIEGTGPVIDHLPAPTGMGYFSSALMVDLNGNGRSELILGSNTPGRNTIHSWTGEGYDRVELPDPSAAANFHVTDIQSADINGDGRADLVLGYTREQPYYAGYFLQVLIQRPDGSFADETAARFGPDAFNPTGNAGQGWPKEITLSDLDGDGRVDILLEPRWPGQERLFLQRPDGRFVWQDFGVAFGDSLMVADLDGDGVTEIVSLGNSGPWGATQLRVYDVAQVARSFTPVSPREKTGTAANDRLTADAAGRILFGRAGNDTLQGSALADRLHGETGDDSLAGDDGNDTLYGGLGNDRLLGGAGEDELWLGPGANHAEGGAGADRIFCGSGADTAHGDAGADEILGGVGDDHLFGGADPDRIMGGDGNDALWGDDGDDSLSGGNGDDSLSGGEGHDILHAGDGADSLRGDDGNDTLQGEAGDDLLIGGGGDDLLSGHAGHDRLDGGAGRDRLEGGEGDDRLSGGAGNDLLQGAQGNDDLSGGAGSDRLSGDAGNDRLSGDGGNDLLTGGAGRDTLVGGSGTDRLFGEAGGDILAGGGGRDRLWGGTGNDRLSGNAGNDILDGGAGRDRLLGQAGRDRLIGQDGNDTLIGGAGNDTLDAGRGRDVMTGGTGADRFIFRDAAQFATITDFRPWQGDRIDLSDIAAARHFGDVLFSARETTAGVRLLLGPDILVLPGWRISDLADDQFLF